MPKISGISPLLIMVQLIKNDSYKFEKLILQKIKNFSAKNWCAGILETKGSTIDRILKNDLLGEKRSTYLGLSNFWNHLRLDVKNKSLN